MREQPHRVLIGYEPTEDMAYRVCRDSMRASSSVPLFIEPIEQSALRTTGLYRRTFFADGAQRYDAIDGKPFSTEFSFTRFLVPAICQYSGWVLFCDSDFLWRADVADLFAYADDDLAMLCVKHEHDPTETNKMRAGQIQTRYRRKNWSSMMLWNCGHPANRLLTPYTVNSAPGWWLHGMGWLGDSQIGSVPTGWNWLDGHSSPDINPMVVHYTTGTPDVPGHENAAHASDWRDYAGKYQAAAAE